MFPHHPECLRDSPGFVDVTVTYFKYLRPNAVRSMLEANPHLGIGEAVRPNGFHHLGNFAADYRRLFDERPSEAQR
jgi:AraC family ethanolamine operon transcriptional activator